MVINYAMNIIQSGLLYRISFVRRCSRNVWSCPQSEDYQFSLDQDCVLERYNCRQS